MEPLTEQEQAYLLQALMQRPLVESLPLYLKMTGQKIVRDAQAAAAPAVPAE